MRFKYFTLKGNILTMEIRSKMNDAKFKAICNELDQAVATLGKIRLVIVVRHYPSFDSGEGFYDDLRFLRLYDDSIEKVAIVSDQAQDQTWMGLFSLFSGVKMELFDVSQIRKASSWIQTG